MAQYEEFTLSQGADLAIEVHLVNGQGDPKDLTNHAIAGRLKKSYSSLTHTDFNAIVAAPPTDGIATLSLTNVVTETLEKGRYVYDVNISFTDSGGDVIVERVLEGRLQVTPRVTPAPVGSGGTD
jgi:hypothetical protein